MSCDDPDFPTFDQEEADAEHAKFLKWLEEKDLRINGPKMEQPLRPDVQKVKDTLTAYCEDQDRAKAAEGFAQAYVMYHKKPAYDTKELNDCHFMCVVFGLSTVKTPQDVFNLVMRLPPTPFG